MTGDLRCGRRWRRPGLSSQLQDRCRYCHNTRLQDRPVLQAASSHRLTEEEKPQGELGWWPHWSRLWKKSPLKCLELGPAELACELTDVAKIELTKNIPQNFLNGSREWASANYQIPLSCTRTSKLTVSKLQWQNVNTKKGVALRLPLYNWPCTLPAFLRLAIYSQKYIFKIKIAKIMRFMGISIARIRLKFKKKSLGFLYIVQLGLAKNIEGCFKILLSYLACSQM